MKYPQPRKRRYTSLTLRCCDTHGKQEMRVNLVDGTWVRDNLDVSWVGGGNPERDPYIPKDEFWIEDGFCDEDTRAFLVHEVAEWANMAANGHKYKPAHEDANRKAEAEFRRKFYGAKAPYVEEGDGE